MPIRCSKPHFQQKVKHTVHHPAGTPRVNQAPLMGHLPRRAYNSICRLTVTVHEELAYNWEKEAGGGR